ncbi:MAG: MFS transporter [Dehalococcoidales bacterium]
MTVVAFFIVTIMWGSLYTFGIFFGPLLEEFGWTRATTSGAFSLSFIMFGFLGIVAGKLTDRFGPRKVVTICGLTLGSGYILMSLVSTLWQIYFFYGVIVAIGMSGCAVPLASTVSRWFTTRRGMMTGVVVSGVGAGTLIVPPIANWLLANYSWRTSYLLLGIAVIVLVILLAQFIRRDPTEMGLQPYGEINSGQKRDLQSMGLSLREAICTQQFWLISGAFFCFTLGLGAVMVHIVPHAIDLGISATGAALILTIVGGLSIMGRVVMGMTSDRIGYKRTIIIGLAMVLISFCWSLFANELWQLYLFAIIFGFGYGAISATVFPLVAEYFGLGSHGAILGFLIFSGESGNGIGPVVTGHIYDITGSYQLAFLIWALVSFVGIILILRLRQPS